MVQRPVTDSAARDGIANALEAQASRSASGDEHVIGGLPVIEVLYYSNEVRVCRAVMLQPWCSAAARQSSQRTKRFLSACMYVGSLITPAGL
jgi:hypothetical protein